MALGCGGAITPPSFAVGPPTTVTITLNGPFSCALSGFSVITTLPDGTECEPVHYPINFPVCPLNICPCPKLAEDINDGFSDEFNCPMGIYTPNSLTSCDVVDWISNGMYLGSSIGNEPFEFFYPSEGSYTVCMSVWRTDDNGQTCQRTFCKNILITTWCPGQFSRLFKLKLFPNPGTERLNVTTDTGFPIPSGILRITDINGKPVYQEQTASKEIIELNISTLSSGMYFLSVEGEKGFRVMERFIKIKPK